MEDKGRFPKLLHRTFLIMAVLCALSISMGHAQAATNWKEKLGEPQYGGKLVLAVNNINNTFDPYNFFHSVYVIFEQLFMADWTLDRENEWSFKILGLSPKMRGLLAKSWEFEDPQTLVVHLRQGVRWHNKQPTFGREFVAEDVVYHYNRILGQGEFDKPNPLSRMMIEPVESVSARDKYTAVIHFKRPHPLINWWTVNDPGCMNMIEPREIVDAGKPEDFRYSTSTGPYMFTDYVAGSSVTVSRNPDYYLFDEKYPDKRLPYFDEVKRILISDLATRLAAIRSGKVDVVSAVGWQNVKALQQSNPELTISKRSANGQTLGMRLDRKPFTDIRVRKALQLAVDIKGIAESHLGGYPSSDPPGLVATDSIGYTRPYKEWPKDLQEEYTYNPDKARKLLAEAGYPNGFDTNIYANSIDDVELLEIIKSQFEDIGVNMEIRVMDRAQMGPFLRSKKHDQMVYGFFCNQTFPVNMCFNNLTSKSSSNACLPSPEEAKPYDDLYQKFLSSKNEEEAKSYGLQMEEYLFSRHWQVISPSKVVFDVLSPRIKGYSGEIVGEHFPVPWFWARFWCEDGKK